MKNSLTHIDQNIFLICPIVIKNVSVFIFNFYYESIQIRIYVL